MTDPAARRLGFERPRFFDGERLTADDLARRADLRARAALAAQPHPAPVGRRPRADGQRRARRPHGHGRRRLRAGLPRAATSIVAQDTRAAGAAGPRRHVLADRLLARRRRALPPVQRSGLVRRRGRGAPARARARALPDRPRRRSSPSATTPGVTSCLAKVTVSRTARSNRRRTRPSATTRPSTGPTSAPGQTVSGDTTWRAVAGRRPTPWAWRRRSRPRRPRSRPCPPTRRA